MAQKYPPNKDKNKITPEVAERAEALTLKGIEEALKDRGITEEYLARKLKSELNASERKVFCTKDGKIVYSKKMVAWETRQKARQDAHQLLRHYPVERKELSGPQGESLVVNLVSSKIESEVQIKSENGNN